MFYQPVSGCPKGLLGGVWLSPSWAANNLARNWDGMWHINKTVTMFANLDFLWLFSITHHSKIMEFHKTLMEIFSKQSHPITMVLLHTFLQHNNICVASCKAPHQLKDGMCPLRRLTIRFWHTIEPVVLHFCCQILCGLWTWILGSFIPPKA